MKSYHYLFILSFLLFSCEENNEESPSYSSKYNHGLYIATDDGVSFYEDGDLENDIFQDVNGIALNKVKRIKFNDEKVYIASENDLYVADVKTFENLGFVTGFSELVDFDFVYNNRIFAVDREESIVKVIDIDAMEVISEIETGDTTRPTFIITKSYRSFVMNGGSSNENIKDSIIIAFDHRYGNSVASADFIGALYVGDNPNSAINDNELFVLCRGVYNENDMSESTNSSLVRVDPYGELRLEWSEDLNNIYNADNLVSNLSDELSFTCDKGIYSIDKNGNGLSPIIPDLISDILYYHDEEYPVTIVTTDTVITPDTTYIETNTSVYYENRIVLYVNDAENDNKTVYKYSIDDGAYIDTIFLDSPVNDIVYY